MTIQMTPDTRRAGAREWAALAVLMLPVLMVSVDNTVLSFALPSISVDLRPSGTQLLWIVDVYAIMLAGLLIAWGGIGDRVGRRKLLLIGSVGFGAASMLAASSSSPEMLLAARMMLGFFGAMLMPSTLSIIRNVFVHQDDRRIAIATWAAMFSGGAALGPIVGGWLLGHFSWHSVFWINLPIILALLPLAMTLLPESRDPQPGPLDVPAIGLSLLTMFPLVFGIKHVVKAGHDDATLIAFGTALVAGWALIRRLQVAAHPMIDLSLFRNRVFSGAIVANLLSLMALTGFLFLGAQLLQLVLGMTPMYAALVLLPGLVVTVVAGFVAVRLMHSYPVRVLVSLSFAASAIGYAVMALVGSPTALSVGLAFALMGAGIGLAETITNDLMLSAVPPSRAGAAAAISETAYEIGAVLGTAVLGTALTAVYRAHLTVPAVAWWGEENGAFETLGGTMNVAKSYSGEFGEQIVTSAHAAFDLAVQTTSALAIAIALGAAVISWRTLKDA